MVAGTSGATFALGVKVKVVLVWHVGAPTDFLRSRS